MSYNLFLDDYREPMNTGAITDWTIVRNYNEFVKIITEKGLPTFVTFDHDLAFEHYPLAEEHPTMAIPYNNYKEKTGYHCAQWLIEYCQKNQKSLPIWKVHSMNPVGKTNISQLLTRFQELQNHKEKHE